MVDRVEITQPGYDQVFKSRDGLVGRDLSVRATRVQLAGKAQAGVRSGDLKRDITKNWVNVAKPDTLTIQVGSARKYAEMHHEGTRAHIIRPRNVKAMRWIDDHGRVHFSRQVMHPGTHANRFLTDNLPLAVR